MSELDPETQKILDQLAREFRELLASGRWPHGTPRVAADFCDHIVQWRLEDNPSHVDFAVLIALRSDMPLPATAKSEIEVAITRRLSEPSAAKAGKAKRYYWSKKAYFYMATLMFNGIDLEEASAMAAVALDKSSKGEARYMASTLQKNYEQRWRSTGAEAAYFEELRHTPMTEEQWADLIGLMPRLSETATHRRGKRR